MKTKTIKQLAIYSRKSKFTGKGESIENQVEMCRQYIAAHYSQEEADAALIYEDEGFSGGTLERPRFKKMMDDSQKIKFAAIVVYRLDRISRNIGDFAKLIEDLGSREIGFVSIREQFDTTSPMGRAMMYIASVFSQLERETIAERIKDNLRELSKTGRWLGGTTPTGYESESVSSVTVDGKTRKACKLKIIPEEINLVRLIYDKFIETGSLTKTNQFLLQGHYRTKRGKSFTRFAVKSILSNPVYMVADGDAYNYLVEKNVGLFSENNAFDGKCGIMAYNRTLQRAGKATQEKPMNEWIVSVGKHEGVIPGAVWVKVQNLLQLNKSKNYRKPRSNAALLSGILCCGKCGAYMRPKMSGRMTAEGEPVYTYLCTSKERGKDHGCDMKNAGGNMLDRKIISVAESFGGQGYEMARQIKQTKKRISGNCRACEAEAVKIKSQLKETEKDIESLVLSLGKSCGAPAEKYIMERINEFHEKGESMKKRLSELEAILRRHELAADDFDLIRRRLSAMGESIKDYSVEQKRAAVRAFVRKIIWDGEDAHVYLFHNDDCGPSYLPYSGGDPDNSGEPLWEDSKRDTYEPEEGKKASGADVASGANRL